MLRISLLGLFFGTIGTTIGGIIGIISKRNSNRFLSFILAFVSGLMLAVVCFDLIPESLEISSLTIVIVGIILGIIVMTICDILVDKKFNNSNSIKSSLLRTGIVVSIGLALHNIPEGLAIGSGFDASNKLRKDVSLQKRYSNFKYLSSRTLLSKGLEFDCVIIDMTTPLSAKDFYVAMTRAMKKIYIISKSSKFTFDN